MQDSGRIMQDDASSYKNIFQNLAISYKTQSWINTNLCYQTLIRNQKFLLIKGSNKCVFGWRILHSSQSLFITSVLFSLSFRILLVSVFIEFLKIIYVLPAHWVRQYLQKRRSPLAGDTSQKTPLFMEITMFAHNRICPKILRKLGLRDLCKQHCSRSSYNHNGNGLSQSIKSDSMSLRLIIPAVS